MIRLRVQATDAGAAIERERGNLDRGDGGPTDYGDTTHWGETADRALPVHGEAFKPAGRE